jgi:glycerophosphoryl diester phosphodiesterase
VEVHAHRGGAGLAPENTLAAFAGALRLGVDAIELDVGLTAGGDVVVAHDPPWESGLPTLADVVALDDGRVRFDVEVKSGDPDRVVDAILSAAPADRTTVISFDWDVLAAARGRVRTGALADASTIDPRAFEGELAHMAVGLGADVVLPAKDDVTDALVAEAHRLGLAVWVWTVNEPAEMETLVARGVDAIITDYPDRLLRLLS